MDLKFCFVFLSFMIWNLDQKTVVFVYGKSTTVSPRDLPHGDTLEPFEEKLLDLFGTGNEVSWEHINSLLSDNSTDIRQQIEILQYAKDHIIALKEKLERQKLDKSRNKEQTQLVTVTETNFNTGKVMDLLQQDLDNETDQTAVTSIPSSSKNYTFEEPSEIEKTSETLIYSSFYDAKERSIRLLLEDRNFTPDTNTKEFRLILTAEPSLNTSSNISEFSNEYTKLANNTPTNILAVEKTAGVITESTKDYSAVIHPATVKIQSIEPEVSLGNSRTSDMFTVTSIPKVISSTEKTFIEPDPSGVSSNAISPENTSRSQYSTPFSSIGQNNEISRVDKSKYSEIKILDTMLENDVKYTSFDADCYNFLINSIVSNVLENFFSFVLRKNGGFLEEIRSIDHLFVKEMEDDLPSDYLEAYEDILELFRLYVLRVIQKQRNDGTFFYHNRGNSSTPYENELE